MRRRAVQGVGGGGAIASAAAHCAAATHLAVLAVARLGHGEHVPRRRNGKVHAAHVLELDERRSQLNVARLLSFVRLR